MKIILYILSLFRLDKVLGISKSVDSYESGPSLASRICKIERQVNFFHIEDEL